MTTPRGNLFDYFYDDEGKGLLVEAWDPGASTARTLQRSEGEDWYSVDFTSAEGLTTSYLVEQHAGGTRKYINTFPSGQENEADTTSDGVKELRRPDGTFIVMK